MGGRWNAFAFQLSYLIAFISGVLPDIGKRPPLNLEGLALLHFKRNVDNDPHGALENWNSDDDTPCMWHGVHCIDEKVQALDLRGLSLRGFLVPEMSRLSHLKYLILRENNITGVIPREFGGLKGLVQLDLGDNNLNGTIPEEMNQMSSLRCLFLCGNKFRGDIPQDLRNLDELRLDESPTVPCTDRKVNQWLKMERRCSVGDGARCCCYNINRTRSAFRMDLVRRREMQAVEESSSSSRNNLPAIRPPRRYPSGQVTDVPASHNSGSFRAIPHDEEAPSAAPKPSVAPSPTESSVGDANTTRLGELKSNDDKKILTVILVSVGVMLLLSSVLAILCCLKRDGVRARSIRPWKTGLSGQLQKAFITGVPKLNRGELETACEDFSNIIDTLHDCVLYKGTLSSGVEIMVVSTTVTRPKDWTKQSELTYREKVDTLSRVNHKNFVNLLGYCEENHPFNRMLVFEYAPNGTLYEHLHVKVFEHLDWNARMRITMGVAYCLRYMHHDLDPPVAHPRLTSASVYLTDDYAAKIAEIGLWSDRLKGGEEGSCPCYHSGTASDVFSFGLLLIEIISGRPLDSENESSTVAWATECLKGASRSGLVDPTLKTFKSQDLDVMCDVIMNCIHPDASVRPTMRDVASRLGSVLSVSQDAATPKLSPLWWAELEILSMEAT